MFLLIATYIRVESFFFKAKKSENSIYKDDLETFFKFYNFFNNNETYFNKFLKNLI